MICYHGPGEGLPLRMRNDRGGNTRVTSPEDSFTLADKIGDVRLLKSGGTISFLQFVNEVNKVGES
jgi:hypothetical protein